MLKSCLLLIAFPLLVSTSLCQTPLTSEKKNIETAIINFFNGLSILNLDTVKAYSTNDLLILENGIIWNMDTLQKIVNRFENSDFKRINRVTFFNTEVDGATGWVYYDNQADIYFKGQQIKLHWLESAVLRKEGVQWKIRLLHSTKLEN